MSKEEIAKLKRDAEALKYHSSPIHLRISQGDKDSGKPETIWRDPWTGKLMEPGEEGAVEYRRWWATISTEKKDRHQTIIERNASVSAFLEWMDADGGNIRFMHEMDPIGRIFREDYEIRDEGIYAGFSIPVNEKKVIQKIDSGLIRFVSIGFNIDWSSSSVEPVIWDPDGTTRIRRIIMVEISLGDFGSCPGTQIQEERLSGYMNERTSGNTPDTNKEGQDKEETELTQEEIIKAMKGVIGPLEERLTKIEESLPRESESPDPSDGKPDPQKDPKEESQDSQIESRMDQIEKNQSAILKALENFGNGAQGTRTSGKSFSDTLEEFEKNLEDTPPDPNQELCFIKDESGRSLTINRLAGEMRNVRR